MELREAIKKRRTHKEFSGHPIPRETLNELLHLSMMAPNHRRNWPWKFTVIEYHQIENFWQKLCDGFPQAYPNQKDEFLHEKKVSLEKRVLRLGGLVYVSCLKNPSPLIEQENYAACCCAVENLLLLATDKNLGSFWCTGGLFFTQLAYKLLGLNSEEEFFVGAIWLGTPTGDPLPPEYHPETKIKFWKDL